MQNSRVYHSKPIDICLTPPPKDQFSTLASSIPASTPYRYLVSDSPGLSSHSNTSWSFDCLATTLVHLLATWNCYRSQKGRCKHLVSFLLSRTSCPCLMTHLVHQSVDVVFAWIITFVHNTEPKSHVPSCWSSMVRIAFKSQYIFAPAKWSLFLPAWMADHGLRLIIQNQCISLQAGDKENDLLSIVGSNMNPPPNSFAPAAFPVAPGVTTQLSYHLLLERS